MNKEKAIKEIKNEETLAMISVYMFGNPAAKLEAKKWLQKVMEGV